MQYIANHYPTKPAPKQLLNPSLIVLGGSALMVVVWVAFGGFYPNLVNEFAVGEDGVIETATAILFLVAAGFSGHLFLTLKEKRRRLAHLILATGFLFIFIEEISWGQRILRFETPDLLMAVNAQGEFNVHNSFGFAADHIFNAGVIIYGVLMPILASRSQFFHHLFDLIGFPIASLGLAIGFALAATFHNWSLYSVLPETHLRVGEARELLCAFGFLILMIEARSPRYQ